MIGKQLLLTLRGLRKNLLYTLLVVGGLSIGISTFLCTFQWSAWHLTFDRNFPESTQLYRLTFEESQEGFHRHTARILHGSALNKIVFSEIHTGIASIGRLAPFRKAAIKIGKNSFYEQHVYEADAAFLGFFQPEVISGRRDSLLSEPFTAVLTASTARKYFDTKDPVGETLELIHQFETEAVTYTVAAVISDFPENSHMDIRILTSFENPMEYINSAWTYLKIAPGKEPGDLEKELKIFLEANVEESYAEVITPRLQPVRDIHLRSHKASELQPNIRFRTVLIVLTAGMLVFVLAWFNFTLLAFSRNQIQIQKLVVQWQMGADREVFFRQFFLTNLLTGSVAFIIGTGLTFLLQQVIEGTGGILVFYDPKITLLSLLILLVLIVLSALVTSLLSTERVFRHLHRRFRSPRFGGQSRQTGKNFIIRAVIVLEFIITSVLLTNLLMISRQTRFAMGEQLGASQEEAIHLSSLHREIVDDFELFKERMMESPSIASVSASMEVPTGQTMDANTFEIDGLDEGDKQLFLFPVEEEFIRFYGLEIKYGANLPETYNPLDSAEYFVLNETAALMLTNKPEELIGKELTLHFGHPGFIWPGPIIGIVEDFHFSGLDYEISPMVIFPKYTWLLCFSILPAGDPEPALAHLQLVWEELFPSYPLEHYTSSELIGQLYKSELEQIRLLLIFSVLSIIIAGLGLFALSGLFIQKKIKSAALKKISGASMHHIFVPELLYYLWLAIISSALALPISYFLVERWLRNFQYRTDFPLWIFPACGAILILFSWISVFYHTIRLSRTNPIAFIREQ